MTRHCHDLETFARPADPADQKWHIGCYSQTVENGIHAMINPVSVGGGLEVAEPAETMNDFTKSPAYPP